MPSLIPVPSPGHTRWHMDIPTTNTLNIKLVWCDHLSAKLCSISVCFKVMAKVTSQMPTVLLSLCPCFYMSPGPGPPCLD